MRRLLALTAGLVLLGLVAVFWRELYRAYRGYSAGTLVVIDPGTRAPEVAKLLADRGVLAYRWPFLFRYWLGRPRHALKAGEYLFDRPLRPVDVYRKLLQGEVYLHAVVIPEGSDRFDIARILRQQLGVNSQEFIAVTEISSPIRDLDPGAPTLEGYLFPDTYLFARGVSSAMVVAAMLARFRQVLESRFREEASRFAGSPQALHDAITLASLVEKETPEPAERAVIAGVFARRLKKGLPLQCDPTVVYAARLNHRSIGPIKQGDLDFNSPYNTYRHVGLPPGPISNPGEASIRAAFESVPGDFLYFVSNNHGGHFFARTLAEHQRNVARYRRQLAQLHREAPDARTHPGRPFRNQRGGSTGAKTGSAKSAKHSN